MGDVGETGFTLQETTPDDMPEMAAIFLRALSWDPICIELDKVMPFDEPIAFVSKKLCEEAECRA